MPFPKLNFETIHCHFKLKFKLSISVVTKIGLEKLNISDTPKIPIKNTHTRAKKKKKNRALFKIAFLEEHF